MASDDELWLDVPKTSPGEMLFPYTPLEDNSNYIRLLRIDDSKQDGLISCQLSQWHVNEVPAYDAISYTWGDPLSDISILVNGKRMTVRRNCEYVLQQACRFDSNVYYWVDAICIDQTSNAEKSAQVQQMGEIFNRAERVLACVGPHVDQDLSEYAFRVMIRWCEFLREASAIPTQGGAFYTYVREFHGLLSSWKAWRLSETKLLNTERTQIRKDSGRQALNDMDPLKSWRAYFFERHYFQRLWIVQELCLAREVWMCCGKDAVRIELVQGLLKVMIHETAKQSRPRMRRLRLPGTPLPKRSDLKAKTQMITFACSNSNMHSSHLREWIPRVMDLKCQDPRDTIYALLSLIRWKHSDSKPICVDYEKSALVLAMEVAHRLEKDEPRYPTTHIIDVLQKLVQNLRLSSDNGEVRKLLRLEDQHAMATCLSYPHPDLASNADKRVMCALFWGSRLRIEDLQWKLDFFTGDDKCPAIQLAAKKYTSASARKDGNTSPQDTLKLFHHGGHLGAQLCNSARDRDWLICASKNSDVALVVREAPGAGLRR